MPVNLLQAKGRAARAEREIQLATQAVHRRDVLFVLPLFESLYVLPPIVGGKGRFCDLFHRNRKVNSLGVFAAFVVRGFLFRRVSSALDSSSAAAAVASESSSDEALAAPTMPIPTMAIPATQKKRVTKSIQESKFVQ